MPVGVHCVQLWLPVCIVIIALFQVCCLAPSLRAYGSSCPPIMLHIPYCVGNFEERLDNIPYHSALQEKGSRVSNAFNPIWTIYSVISAVERHRLPRHLMKFCHCIYTVNKELYRNSIDMICLLCVSLHFWLRLERSAEGSSTCGHSCGYDVKKKGFFLVDVANRTTWFTVITWNDRLWLISSSHFRPSLIVGFMRRIK